MLDWALLSSPYNVFLLIRHVLPAKNVTYHSSFRLNNVMLTFSSATLKSQHNGIRLFDLQTIVVAFTDNAAAEVNIIVRDHPHIHHVIKDLLYSQKIVTQALDPSHPLYSMLLPDILTVLRCSTLRIHNFTPVLP